MRSHHRWWHAKIAERLAFSARQPATKYLFGLQFSLTKPPWKQREFYWLLEFLLFPCISPHKQAVETWSQSWCQIIKKYLDQQYLNCWSKWSSVVLLIIASWKHSIIRGKDCSSRIDLYDLAKQQILLLAPSTAYLYAGQLSGQIHWIWLGTFPILKWPEFIRELAFGCA